VLKDASALPKKWTMSATAPRSNNFPKKNTYP